MLGVCNRDCESIMTLASLFVKGGVRGVLSHRLLIFNNNFLIDQISPNPSLLKRGIKGILSQSQYAPTVFFIVSTPIRNLCRSLCNKRGEVVARLFYVQFIR
jgi:hypothetical protein